MYTLNQKVCGMVEYFFLDRIHESMNENIHIYLNSSREQIENININENIYVISARPPYRPTLTPNMNYTYRLRDHFQYFHILDKVCLSFCHVT